MAFYIRGEIIFNLTSIRSLLNYILNIAEESIFFPRSFCFFLFIYNYIENLFQFKSYFFLKHRVLKFTNRNLTLRIKFLLLRTYLSFFLIKR